MPGIAGDNALTIALLVIAFEEGGALAVGLFGVVRIAPSIVAAPLAAGPAGRYPATRLLFIIQLIRLIAAVAVVAVIAGRGMAAGHLPRQRHWRNGGRSRSSVPGDSVAVAGPHPG